MADVGRMAGMFGISTQALEELRYPAEKSGVAIDTLDDRMKELQIRAVDATAGEGEVAEAFKKIGLLDYFLANIVGRNDLHFRGFLSFVKGIFIGTPNMSSGSD